MARGPEDLIEITLDLDARVSIDLERMEQDPIFRQYLSMDSNPDEPNRQAAMQACLAHYIIRDRFLREMPFTNGPGCFILKGLVEPAHAPEIGSIKEL